jgi:uncharacterized protein YjbI with pentapeptide repeats
MLNGAQGNNLQSVNVQGVNFREATGLTKEQLQGARNWILAYYSQAVLKILGLPSDHNERIAKKDLGGYDLRGVNLRDANLQGSDFNGYSLAGANL